MRYDRASCQLVSDKLITLPHVFCSARGDLPHTIPTDMWWVEVDGLRRAVHDRAFRVWQLEHRPLPAVAGKPSGSHEAEIDSSDRVVFRGPRTLLPKAIPTYTEWVPHSWVLSPQQRAISEVSPQQRTHPPQQRPLVSKSGLEPTVVGSRSNPFISGQRGVLRAFGARARWLRRASNELYEAAGKHLIN